MTIRAICYDMDGVLVEAKDWHFEALNRALGLFGADITRQEHLSTFDGLPTKTKLQMLSRQGRLPVGLHKFVSHLKQRYTHEAFFVNCRPCFRHQQVMAAMKRMGVKQALCSNSIRSTIDMMVSRSSLGDYFELILSNEDVTRPKPAPDIYLLAMERLGVKPEETLILEDSEYGIQAARASGAAVLEIEEIGEVNIHRIFAKIEEVQCA